MAKFSPAENDLIQSIENDRLRSSLSQLREAVEDIWLPDQRIIRDFTDHGVAHCSRIVEYGSYLLQANFRRALSDNEVYVFLAGVYLHDIGMQCDVTKFPEVAQIAKKFGGDNIEILSNTVSNYSIDEQKTIRKNHQYLTAAWIEYAYKSQTSVINSAIRTIPENLISDVMDVCLFHSTLAITDCPSRFKFIQKERKRFIAAILSILRMLFIGGCTRGQMLLLKGT
jgi:HD superfamily phosphohydrolase YqeK